MTTATLDPEPLDEVGTAEHLKYELRLFGERDATYRIVNGRNYTIARYGSGFRILARGRRDVIRDTAEQVVSYLKTRTK